MIFNGQKITLGTLTCSTRARNALISDVYSEYGQRLEYGNNGFLYIRIEDENIQNERLIANIAHYVKGYCKMNKAIDYLPRNTHWDH